MELKIIELEILHILVNVQPSACDFPSIEAVTAQAAVKNASAHDLAVAVRSLRKMGFVAFEHGDRVKATEMGIAALKSM